MVSKKDLLRDDLGNLVVLLSLDEAAWAWDASTSLCVVCSADVVYTVLDDSALIFSPKSENPGGEAVRLSYARCFPFTLA